MPERQRLVIVANRLPVHRVRQGDTLKWQTSPGGLVAALQPILREFEGVWVGWPGVASDSPDEPTGPFDAGGIRCHPISITSDELDAYYAGFSNRTLWPLYHDAIRPPEFHRRWWWPYTDVNRRFAEAAAAAMQTDDGATWVHDYQLQLVPGMLRELRPGARIGYFSHIPFPPQELLSRLPWRRQLLEGLLGADVIGFQTPLGVQNFLRAARRFTIARGDGDELEFNGRSVQVRSFPISIDVDRFEQLAADPATVHAAHELRRRLGPTRQVLLGVDRLDYTKGIDIRLRAFEELLRRRNHGATECVFVQLAVPSREQVQEYQELRENVERHVGRINGEYGEPGRVAVHYLHRNLSTEQLVSYYLAADVMVVTPFCDGMNLVCKEYVATRLDDSGALVLSEFAGAAIELQEALLVNPFDIDGVASTLEAALEVPVSEARRRMKTLRSMVRSNDVYGWAETFVQAMNP